MPNDRRSTPWYLLVLVFLAACGGGGGSASPAPTGSDPPASTAPPSTPAPSTPAPSTPAPSTPTTPSSGTDVVTYKNDVLRTGQNVTETVLTPSNVNSSTFGLLHNLKVDGKIDAQPLYLSQLSVGGSTHNVVFVATENDSVYAFD